MDMVESGTAYAWARSITGLAIGLAVVRCNGATVPTTVPGSGTANEPVNPSASKTPASEPTSSPVTARTSVPALPTDLMAFASKRNGTRQVYEMRADGSGLVRISHDQAGEQPSAWSNDRTRLLFSSDRGGHDEIYVMNADGTNPKRVAASTFPASGAHWSPDGTTIVFNADTSGTGCYQVFSMHADGSAVKQLTTAGACNWSPVWSRSGDEIALSTNRD